MSTTTLRVSELVKWSAPRRVSTRQGDRNLRTARATEEFWRAWKSSKDQLKAAGVSCSKDRDTGEWQACWWQPLSEEEQAEEHEALEASAALDANVDIPRPEGLEYLPYQRAGINYAMQREATLIGDEMGLGKTIQGIGVVNATPDAQNVLVICPASLKINWQREIEKWLVHDLSVGIVQGTKASSWLDTNVVVINFEVVAKHLERIKKRDWDIIIIDEAHRLKNPKAARTKAILGSPRSGKEPIQAKRRILLTGTPICNRPIELHPLAGYLAPKQFGNFWNFAKRYAGARRTDFGWDFSGATNLDELHKRLRRHCMVRRLKSEVLTDLPAKVRQVVTISAEGFEEFIEAEKGVSDERAAALRRLHALKAVAAKEGTDDYDDEIEQLRKEERTAFTEMSKRRRDLAIAKAPLVVEHLQDIDHPVVVFAHHKAVVDILVEGLGRENCVVVTGETKMEDRQKAVDRFQAGEVQYFIGNIQAAGVGLTLTKSSHVVFAELDWVPGNVSQAEDRCHRIGQEDSVLCQHIVVDGSMDADMAARIVAKQQVIDQALDAGIDELEIEQVQDLAVKIYADENDVDPVSEQKKAAIHACLRHLAGMCDGAKSLDDMGFNGADARFGRALAVRDQLTNRMAAAAEKMLQKYKNTQLGSLWEAVEEAE